MSITSLCPTSALRMLMYFLRSAEIVPQWASHVGQNTVLEDDVRCLPARHCG